VPALASARPGARPAAWGDLRKRAISAAVLAPLALLCIWLGAVPWTALLAVGVAGLAWEWVELCGARPLAWPGVLVPLAVLAAGAVSAADREGLALAVIAAGALAAWAASGRRALALGVPYIALGGIALVWLRSGGAAGRTNVLFVVLLVWASDVGAYAAGRLFGGPKLAPLVSPSKTWAGSAGGLAAAALMGAAVAWASGGGVGRAALLAGGLGVACQAGDLLESWIKRRFGVKDSGRLIPGHGGLLDRLDGLLAAAPAAALAGLSLGQGTLLWN
jgi:phosphatidate cytidylyltransferase